MANKQHTGEQTDDTQITRVRALMAEGRPKPFGVQWRAGGKRFSKFFASSKDRDQEMNRLRKRIGSLTAFTPFDEREWLAFKAAVGDTPWQDVVAAWRHYLQKSRPQDMPVEQATAQFIANAKARFERREIAPDTYRQKKHKATLLARWFPGMHLRDITPRALEEKLPKVPSTFNSFRKYLSAFFNEFPKCVETNPVLGVRLKVERTDTVAILTPEETLRLFAWGLKLRPEIIPRLALEAFCGLRFSSACRVAYTDINWTERGLNLPASKLKTGRRFYIDAMPENLWTFVTKDSGGWHLTPTQYMHLKSKLFVDAGVPHPKNCLRHSFATYHVAAFKNPGNTAALLCHRGQQMLWQRYNGRATQADGLRYFEITKAKCESSVVL